MTRRPKVLIRTLPLEDANYGGILQAYALQRVLRDLGADPVTDISRVDTESRVRALVRKVAVATSVAPRSWIDRVQHDAAGKELAKFVFDNIETVRLYGLGAEQRSRYCESFDLLLSGSDQVWRRRFADVASYMFDFVQGDSSLRASYAASFGSDSLAEYDDDLIRECASLLGRFDAVSVREDSAVELCREQFGVAAYWHLDPTLLLTASQYERVSTRRGAPSGALTTYLLDTQPHMEDVVDGVGKGLGIPVRRLSHAQQGAQGPLPVEEWLAAFRGARCVITDSFHGTVFAIIHKVPFVTVANEGRGRARFDSLLGLLDLSESLFAPQDLSIEAVRARLGTPFEWESVELTLDRERERSMGYLGGLLERARVRERA